MASPMPISRDREQTRRMHHRSMRQITDVLGVCLNSTRTKEQWSCLRRDGHQELYAKRTYQGVSNGPSVYYLAVNEAFCGFDEVFNLLHFDTTAQFRLMMKLLHGRDFKDGALLSMRTKEHSLGDWTMDTQHAAVWFVHQDHRKSVVLPEQHLTFFQTLKIFLPGHHDHDFHNTVASTSTDSSMAGLNARPNDGVHKRTIALSWLPFPRSHEAMLQTAQQVNLQYTLIVEEISPNRLRLSCVTSSFHDMNDGPLAGSPRAARAIARRLALRSVGKLEAAVAASRIGDCQLVAPYQWVKNEDRVRCVICWKRFQIIFRRRHHCRLCGEVICGSCCSLRTINTVNVKTKAAQKTRICHICNNKTRVKTNTQTFSSNNHGCSIPSSHQRWEQYPRPGSESDSEIPLSLRVLPANLKAVAGLDFVSSPPSVGPMISQSFKAHEYEDSENDGYIGALPDRTAAAVSNKIISIKSITRGTKLLWHTIPSTKSSLKSLWSLQALDSSSVDSTCSVTSSSWAQNNSDEVRASRFDLNNSMSFLHPAAITTRPRKMTQPISITAEVSSCSSADRSSFLSYGFVNSKECNRADSTKTDDRRTSLMSSNAGLLDQDSLVDEDYLLPKLDGEREEQRLKLLEVIVSPACTLVDRTVMQQSCEIAAAAFGLTTAFIARVDEEYVLIEHIIGTRDVSAQDEILRHESLCDFVLCQPQHQPLVILDCLTDPRTRDILMVQHLRIRFFVGISVCVRGLPMACLCVFRQDNDKQSQEDDNIMRTRHYSLNHLEHAAHRIEDELENLVYGLELC